MGNSFFQFQQFQIEQGNSSMKVCTDSCIFGAFVALKEKERSPVQILDIGAGTGLLSLMLAQKFPMAKISAIEIHPGSFDDCRANFQHSPWGDRLQVILEDFSEFSMSGHPGVFDLIVCNPPFFLDHLNSPDEGRNQSRHGRFSHLLDWMKKVDGICTAHARIWLLLPPDSWKKLEPYLHQLGWFVHTHLILNQKSGRNWRNILCFQKQEPTSVETLNLPVYGEDGALFSTLRLWLSDYYL